MNSMIEKKLSRIFTKESGNKGSSDPYPVFKRCGANNPQGKALGRTRKASIITPVRLSQCFSLSPTTSLLGVWIKA